MTWLARKMAYTPEHVMEVLAGRQRPSLRFRRSCSLVLGIPESDLFREEVCA